MATIGLPTTTVPPPTRQSFPRVLAWSAGTIAAAVLVAAFLLEGPTTVVAASVELERIAEAVTAAVDRTYRVEVVEKRGGRKRGRPGENLDGATLYVRGTDHVVFVRQLASGVTRTSGTDGRESWTFKNDGGPVHVSDDPRRFRSGFPGEEQGLPFVDLRSQLDSLAEGYELEVELSPEEGVGVLRGTKRSREVRGPQEVEIRYDRDSGLIRSMVLVGLPRARGAPRSVRLDLVDESPLPETFFTHGFHHDAERRVLREAQ